MLKTKRKRDFVILLLITMALLLQGCGSGKTTSKYTEEQIKELAQCLTENEVVMYGAFWCPHCLNTKKKFGTSFGYINYVECDPRCKPDENGDILSACKGNPGQPELCLERGIEGYDTWIFKDGTRAIGEPALELLDEKSDCNILPKGEE